MQGASLPHPSFSVNRRRPLTGWQVGDLPHLAQIVLEYDAVARLAGLQMRKCFVGLAHRELLRNRRDAG